MTTAPKPFDWDALKHVLAQRDQSVAAFALQLHDHHTRWGRTVTHEKLRNWQKGRMPSAIDLLIVAAELGVSPYYLMRLDDAPGRGVFVGDEPDEGIPGGGRRVGDQRGEQRSETVRIPRETAG